MSNEADFKRIMGREHAGNVRWKSCNMGLLLFSGMIIEGYWYAISLVWFFGMFDTLALARGNAEIEYLIPLTREQRKRKEILKAVITAAPHALAAGFGYVLTISKWYVWDKEFVFMVTMIFLFVFWYFLNSRIDLVGRQKILFWGTMYLVSVILGLFYFILRKMGNLGFAFLKGDYNTAEYGIAILWLVIAFILTRVNVKKLEFIDYGE